MTIEEKILIIAACKTSARDIVTSLESSIGQGSALPAVVRAVALYGCLADMEQGLAIQGTEEHEKVCPHQPPAGQLPRCPWPCARQKGEVKTMTTQEAIETIKSALDELVCGGCKDVALTALEELRKDTERLEWYFSFDLPKPSSFLDAYFRGMSEKWDVAQWRAAIDVARAAPASHDGAPEGIPPLPTDSAYVCAGCKGPRRVIQRLGGSGAAYGKCDSCGAYGIERSLYAFFPQHYPSPGPSAEASARAEWGDPPPDDPFEMVADRCDRCGSRLNEAAANSSETPNSCPCRKALEFCARNIEHWADGETGHVLQHALDAAKVTFADPCLCDQLRVERDEALEALKPFGPVADYSCAARLEGAEAVDALYDWMAGVDHIHTRHGIVYASAIYDVRLRAAAVLAKHAKENKDAE